MGRIDPVALLEPTREQLRSLSQSFRASKRQPYVYFNTPKCACSTIKTALWAGEAYAGTAGPVVRSKIHSLEGSPFSADLDRLRQLADSAVLFTFVRNPLRRILSCYNDKCREVVVRNPAGVLPVLKKNLGVGERDVSFDEFLEYIGSEDDYFRNTHWRSLTGLVNVDVVKLDYIGAVEQMREDAGVLFETLFPGFEYNPVNANSRSNDGEAMQYLTLDRIKKITQIYKDDFEYFGYSQNLEEIKKSPKLHRWQS